MKRYLRHIPLALVCFLSVSAAAPFTKYKAGNADRSMVRDEGRRLLLHGFSKKRFVETAADHNGSLLFKRSGNRADSIRIVALRIEFKKDTTSSTTGNGLFGIRSGGDAKEIKYYNKETIYKYDDLPHDSAFFDRQLQFVRDYYAAVSRGKLHIGYSIYPGGPNGAYSLDTTMTAYGPGLKKGEETYADHNQRINVRLLRFVRDAIKAADDDPASPFTGLRSVNGVIVDSLGRRTVFLIIHAGSSYLTDGGMEGAMYADSPFDMVDAFISRDFFDYYKDSLKLDSAGITVKGAEGSRFLIDEVMMTCETANQDSLNFGIHGILINQLARQIGIPNLYSTSSAVSAVGAFCIMDFFGFLAGQGFIPPWPSAWVRAFMGWDNPVVVPMGSRSRINVKALCASQPADTTIALIPINDHEYYLLENRQRSLVGGPDIFNYDTAFETQGRRMISIDPYLPLNLAKNVVAQSDTSRTIMSVKNHDASLPASGIIVWHIDEKVINDRLRYDFLNADSAYRAVSIAEADGIGDLGFEFANLYQQSIFDIGGAEDVFPHFTQIPPFTQNRKTSSNKDSTFFINTMGPWTKPSTHANDGGQTYLNITIDTLNVLGTEVSSIRDYYVHNFVDSIFRITVSWDYLVPGWPKRTVREKDESLFDPVACDLYKQNKGREIVALSKMGRLYVWPGDSAGPAWFGDSAACIAAFTNTANATMRNAPTVIAHDTLSIDTVHFLRMKNFNPSNPGRPFTFPTVINNNLFIPLLDTAIDVIKGVAKSAGGGDTLLGDIIPLRYQPSSYVCKLDGKYWAIGCGNGAVFCADAVNYYTDTATVPLPSDTPSAVCALAALPGQPDTFACIQVNSVISIVSIPGKNVVRSRTVEGGLPPYTLVTGDLNHDGANEIVVCDGRKGLWVFQRDLAPAPGWEKAPNDWAGAAFARSADRAALPVNTAPPALADINGDGCLEIIAGGSSGLYALNHRGVPISGWPSYLDNRFYRGQVNCSPAVAQAPAGGKSPLVVFSSPTGENETFEIDRIVSTNKKSGIIVFRRLDGTIDSTSATTSFIDSAIISGDSLIAIVVLYGGLIDAIDPSGGRPQKTIGGNRLHSQWPLTVGAPINELCASPFLDDIDGDGIVEITASAANGWVYQWKSSDGLVGQGAVWKQTGFDGSRSFAYTGPLKPVSDSGALPISFYSWPNPTDKRQTGGRNVVNFKFKFSGPAKNVRLDIFTYTGFHVYSKTDLAGGFPGWNSLDEISLVNFGSGVYRCRMEAEVGGKRYAQYWKMAVVK